MPNMDCTFTQAERLKSKLVIDKLFAGGNASMVAFPLRVVYMKVDGGVPPVAVLVSVPKKRFRHAVDRNRMKRLVREAYRLNKHILWKGLEGKGYGLAVAFVCITGQLPTFRAVNKGMVKALLHISERLNK